MEMTERKNKVQDWISGNIISDGSSSLMICYDNSTQKYRLMDVENGTILTDEYNSLRDLKWKTEISTQFLMQNLFILIKTII